MVVHLSIKTLNTYILSVAASVHAVIISPIHPYPSFHLTAIAQSWRVTLHAFQVNTKTDQSLPYACECTMAVMQKDRGWLASISPNQ